MHGTFDVLMPVEFDNIALLFIDDQAADEVGMVILDVQERLGVAKLVDELPKGTGGGEGLELLRVVSGEGVIHVEANGLDLRHIEGAVAQDFTAVKAFRAAVALVGWVGCSAGLNGRGHSWGCARVSRTVGQVAQT